MIIRIKTTDPLFEQKIELLKLQYKTGAASKAVKAAVENFYEIDRRCELLKAQNESMSAEIDRLRELLKILESTSISTRIAHLRSQRT
jgi:hypothetical protein